MDQGLLRNKCLFQNISLVALSTVVALILVEAILSFSYRDTVQSDPVMEYVHVPGDDWDERGFRNPSILERVSIVAIGDSQTEGNNATSDESWPYVLGRLASTSVYSMAVPGYGPVQYAVLAEEALALKPEIIVVGLYLGNDMLDAHRVTYGLEHWSFLRSDSFAPTETTSTDVDFRTILGSGVRQGSMSYYLLKLRMWIRSHSKVYALLGNTTRGLRERLNWAETRAEKQETIKQIAAEQPDVAYVYDNNPQFETVLSPTYRLDTVDLSESKTSEGWRITQERLKAIHTLATGGKVRLLIAIIPTKEMVYLGYMRKIGDDIPSQFERYIASESNLSQTILAFCERERIECFSTMPDMVDAMASGRALYGSTMDGHPKASGYKVISESIYRALFEAPTR